jgi:hypothetical protein
MRLRMLTTMRGAEDGCTVREYREGVEYELGGTPRADELARVFLREGWAEEASAPPPAPPESPPAPVATTPQPPAAPAPRAPKGKGR